jgi:hypothetical protein
VIHGRGSRAVRSLLAAAWPLAATLAAAALPAVQHEKGQGVDADFVAYPWRPDVFAAFEEGRSPAPPSWAFARLGLSAEFLLGDRRLAPGHYAMVLAPKVGTLPMTLELRRIGGHEELFGDPTAMPSPPPGETAWKGPATFTPEAEPVPVLDLTIASYSEGAVLTIRYGNRRLALELTRTEP